MRKMSKEEREQERERRKCVTYVDKEKVEEIFAKYAYKIEQRKKFKKYGT